MSGTVVVYNGVEIRNCETLVFNNTIHYDESNTDAVYSVFRCRWRGMIVPGYPMNVGISSGPGNNSAAANYTSIRSQLMQPRQSLTVTIGPDTLITCTGQNLAAADADVNNGPKPQALDIIHVAGFRVLTVEFEIEFAIMACDGKPHGDPAAVAAVINTPEVISNRWTAQETRDENFYSELEYSGALKVRRITQGPDLFRYLVVPPLLPGFQRMRCNFTVEPNGLGMHYRVMDKQQYAAPPPPATDWEAHYTIEAQNQAKIYSTVDVSLNGPPGVNRGALLVAALQVCEARLGNLRQVPVNPAPGGGNQPPRAVMVESATIREQLKDNKIQVTIRALETTAAENLSAMLSLPFQKIGVSLADGPERVDGYNAIHWPVPTLYNYAVGAFVMKLADPCLKKIPSLAGEQLVGEGAKRPPPPKSPGDPPGDNTAIDFRFSTGTLSDYPTKISPAQRAHIYTVVEIYNNYETTTGIYMLPKADSPAPNRPTADFVDLHGPITTRVLKMRAERAYVRPEMPKAERIRKDLNGITEYLLSKQVVAVSPTLLADGKNFLFAAEVQYVYGLSREPTDNELLIAGASPIDTLTANQTAFPMANLKDTKIQGGNSQ
ncbi:MAG: hypothetical protein K8T91_23145 [Planctomycetes bacterium]|nr:hypothetical protein [Planctomycetota bacterium]